MNSLAHVEINVSNLQKSKEFYNLVLSQIYWKYFKLDDENVAGFSGPDKTHLFLVQTEKDFLTSVFHRKNTGLNHLAFRVETKEQVDEFCNFLKTQNITRLYHDQPKDYSCEYAMEHYYAIFFEDPDRIKLEVVFMK